MKNKLLKSILAGIILFSSSLTLNAAPIDSRVGSVRSSRIQTSDTGTRQTRQTRNTKQDTEQMAKFQEDYYSKPKSSIFLGLGIGASVITRSADLEEFIGTKSGNLNLGLGVNWGGKIGYQLYITKRQGFRIYASYDQTWGFPGQLANGSVSYYNGIKREYVFIDRITGNIDYLLDLLAESNKRINLYVGVYGGWAESNQKYKETNTGMSTITSNISIGNNNYDSSYIFGFNVGIGATFARRHRFEIGAKIPIIDLKSIEYCEYFMNSSSNINISIFNNVDTSWMVPTFTFSYIFIL